MDWRLDPGILGLERETDFSLDYRIEHFVHKTSHLDLLLGEGWDFRSASLKYIWDCSTIVPCSIASTCSLLRSVSGSDGFRIILTLELFVDLNQEMRVSLHGTQCPGAEGVFSPRPGQGGAEGAFFSPRAACLAATARLQPSHPTVTVQVQDDG